MTRKGKKNDPAAITNVTVVSPCSSTPAIFPHVFNQGIERMKSIFNLNPTIKPSCRNTTTAPMERAIELNQAFADNKCEAIFCAIGGDDCIRVIPFLDAKVIAANYKPFFGFSDATILHLFLYDCWHHKHYILGTAPQVEEILTSKCKKSFDNHVFSSNFRSNFNFSSKFSF